jgi:outer membrane cobalamin receptor
VKWFFLNKVRFILFFASLFSTSGFSQSLSDTLYIDEVSVISLRPIEKTGITESGIDSLTLSFNITQSLSEILAENSQIFIKSYGRGSVASASFRGTAPSHTKVSWNGLELNSPMLGMVDFSQLPVYIVDDIKLYHGNSSLSYMPGALGGILDLSTNTDFKDRFSGSFLQGIGSFGSIDNYLRINTGNAKIHSVSRLFYNHSDNDFRFVNKDIIDSVNLETGEKFHPVMRNKNAQYSNIGLLQQISYRRTSYELFDMNIWVQQSDRSLPVLSSNESNINSNLNQQSDRFLRSVLKYSIYKERFKAEIFSGINYNSLNYFLDNEISYSQTQREIDSESRVYGFENKFKFNYSLNSKHKAELKLRHLLSSVKSYENIAKYGYSKNRNEFLVLISEYSKWTERIRTRLTISHQFNQSTSSFFIYSLGGEYHLLPSNRLFIRLNTARNQKTPSLNDLYFQPGGNPDLLPEVSVSNEGGIEYNYTKGNTTFNTSFSIYNSDVNDWIIWLPGFKGYWEPVNIERVKSSGLEFNASLMQKRGFVNYRIKGNYAFTKSLNYGDKLNWADESLGKQLPYIPLHSANLSILLDRKNWSLNYNWNYFSERFTTSSNQKATERDYLYPYFMSQLRLGKTLYVKNTVASLGFTVYNLLNEEYRSVLQRPMPGRNYHLILKIDF